MEGKTTDWKSKKLWTTFLALGLISWGFLVAGHPHELYGEFVMGILTASGLYKAANVFEKRGVKPADPKVG